MRSGAGGESLRPPLTVTWGYREDAALPTSWWSALQQATLHRRCCFTKTVREQLHRSDIGNKYLPPIFVLGGQGTFLQRCIVQRETGPWGPLRTARTVRSSCWSCLPQFFGTAVSVCASLCGEGCERGIYLQREQNRTAANLKLTVGSFP